MNCPTEKNPRAKGSARDKRLLETLERWRALDTEQVWALFFSQIKHGQRKAQERLLKLHRRGMLERTRQGGLYAYYYARPGQLEHLLGVNWVRVWLHVTSPSWQTLQDWLYEVQIGRVRADGLGHLRNHATGQSRFFLLELDRATNDFDKIKKYGQMYEAGEYQGWWWVKLTDRFPPVLIVTTTPTRARQIKERIEKENAADLEFRVMLLDDIRKEVLAKCK